MKKQIFTGLFLLFSIIMTAQNSVAKYENDWKKVETYEADGLPQSASSILDIILKKAIADKDNQQVIKALIYKNKYIMEIDPSDKEGLIKDLEQLVAQTDNITEKGLLHSMISSLYLDYYMGNNNNTDAELADIVPDDMKEWTSNIFAKKIIQNLDLSIKEIETLKKHQTKEFDILIAQGEDSPEYYPTLYDFLMKRAIEIATQLRLAGPDRDITSTGYKPEQLLVPVDEFINLNIDEGKDKRNTVFFYYQQYFRDLLSRKLTGTIILTELDKAALINNYSYRYDNDKKLEVYKKLENKYGNDETSVEITNKIIDILLTDNNSEEKIYNLCNQTIARFPNYKRIGIIKEHLIDLEKPELSISMDNTIYPQKPVDIKIVHKNIQAVDLSPTFRLYKIIGKDSIAIKDYSLKLISDKTFKSDTLKWNIEKLSPGLYTLSYLSKSKIENEQPHISQFDIIPIEGVEDSGSSDEDKNGEDDRSKSFIVSALTSYSRNSAANEYEIFIVDRLTGKPVEGATVIIEQKIDEKTYKTNIKTNKIGLAVFKDLIDWGNRYSYERGKYKVILDSDSNLYASPLYSGRYNTYVQNNKKKEISSSISIFTDRSIYRPGQTVFYKAIIADSENNIISNQPLTITLYNANNEEITNEKINSNEFGSVAGQFTLPQSGLLGWYSIDVNGTKTGFRVEEYKRPTFEITFDKVIGSYTFDQKIQLKGYAKSFSGVNLQDVNVQYRITRQKFNPWFRIRGGSHFNEGIVKTDNNGLFEIEFTPKAEDTNDIFGRNKSYTFNVTATITDPNGETQTGSYSISVGELSMVINIDMPEQIEKTDSSEIVIETANLQGENIQTNGTFILYNLSDNDSIKSKILEENFKTGIQENLRTKLKSLPSGKYRLIVKALDDKENEVEETKDFVLFSYDDKKPPIKIDGWLVEKNITFSVGKPAEIIFGVTDKDIYVLYQVYNNQKIFDRKFIKLNSTNKLFSLAYKEEYGDNVNMSFTYVKDDKFYHNDILIKRETNEEDSNLHIKLEVFRDKLRPGQEETWTISVKNSMGEAITSELLASMYDRSLDKIYPSTTWYLNRLSLKNDYLYPINFRYAFDLRESDYPKQIYLGNISNVDITKPQSFDHINWFGYMILESFFQNEIYGYYRADGAVLMENKVMFATKASPAPVENKQISIRGLSSDSINEESENTDDSNDNVTQVRSNFNETAFFYPQLRTNEKGETLISFTVPESNTSWKFRALAHDKNTKWNTIDTLVVTRKELMVTPNLPRFVRQGDKTCITTKISNLSDKKIDGNVDIEFFDPYTNKAINLEINNKTQFFSIEKNASTSATWSFDIPSDIELIGCRIVAKSEIFSDGEQHVLSVLPNQILITESMPIDVNKVGERTFIFDKLLNSKSNSLNNYRLTLEFANNPAWYAIQALPILSNPSNENAVNWFASYYVNSLGASIVKQYPKVAAMIEAWKKQGETKETLLSRLQQNEDLKNVLLEETPWVLDAKNETEQMQQLSLLFDLNNTKQLTDKATEKLKEMQTYDGGWPWYKDMNPSRSITQYILYGYAELQLKGTEYPDKIKEMQMNALKFIDSKILKDYNYLKKYNKDWEKVTTLSIYQLEYLFVRSYYRDIPINQETREAERFYTTVASKNWIKLSLYERSILSIVLRRNGEKELASKIAKSISEYAKIDTKQGMYWPRNRSNVFMAMSAVSTHIFLMKALQDNGANAKDIDLMKQWLLKQKQTQIWESTHATIEAINILLVSGSDWLIGEKNTKIKIGNKTVDTPSIGIGDGYVKQTWNKAEITSDMGRVSVTHNENQPAYGALYWQYYENLDKVTSQNGDLNISKQLFKEVIGSEGKTLVQITDNNPLRVGEKVVIRLVIKAVNDMDFVQLKDMRASCFEPIETLSGVKWQGNLLYYQTTKDASTNFYFDHLPKGTYILEYPVYVNRQGEYTNGITTIQCLYAPEYISNTAGIKVLVK